MPRSGNSTFLYRPPNTINANIGSVKTDRRFLTLPKTKHLNMYLIDFRGDFAATAETRLNHSMRDHRVRHFNKRRDVRPGEQIAFKAVFFGVLF